MAGTSSDRITTFVSKLPSLSLKGDTEFLKLEDVEEEKFVDNDDLDWSFLDEGQLYDRQEEKSRLMKAFDRQISSSGSNEKELVLVSGHSGTGKTALALTLREPCLSRGGYFISGKFDQLQRPEPYAPFVAAFTEFTQQVVARGPETVSCIKKILREEIDSERQLLMDMIPALAQIMGGDDNESSCNTVKGSESQQQLKLVFCKFVRAICSPERPLVLFIDDLQWADSGSLDLLQTLLASSNSSDGLNNNNSGIMILGTCRYNEVTLEHPLAVMLRYLEDEADLPITNITVGNLTPDAVNEVVSHILRLDLEASWPLADMVHNQTNGNIFFVLQFIKSLHEEGILYKKSKEQDWKWHLDKIHNILTDDCDVVLLVAGQMKRLPEEVQEMLKVAACIGSEFEEYLLHDVLNPSQVAEALATAVEKGFCLVDRPPAGYRFTHDKVQQAAYSLIPEDEIDSFHLSIGQSLWDNLSSEECEQYIFLIVNQLSRGFHLIEEQKDLYDIAILCLLAGEKATLASDFVTAASYLDMGIELLGSRGWRDRYDLSLSLYNAAAEAEYCTANFERMDSLIEQVLLRARSFQDKLRAYTTQVYSLGTRQKLQEAIDTGLDILQRLGESFPNESRVFYKNLDMMNTKRLLRSKSDVALLNLPYMNNPEKVAAMQILNLLFTYTFLGRADFLSFVVCRMIRLTIRYGLCAISALGFSSYGLLLCGNGEIEAGYRYGQLALRILGRFSAKEWLPRVYSLVYGMNNHWTTPLRQCLEPLKCAHKVGLQTGDIEYSMVGAHRYCMESFSAGRPLDKLEEEMNSFCLLMGSYKQDIWSALTLPLLQMVQNFKGQSEDVLVLTGRALNQDAALKEAVDGEFATAVCCIYMWRLVLAFYFGDYHQAYEMAVQSRPMKEVGRSAFVVCLQYFYDGMAALALARDTKQSKKLITAARRARKKLVNLVGHCPENCSNKLLLIDAEFCALRNKLEKAIAKYDESIEVADRQGLLHEKALACERAGLALRYFGEEPRALQYLSRARTLYRDWGAYAKVKQIEGTTWSTSSEMAPSIVPSGSRVNSAGDEPDSPARELACRSL